MASNNNTFLYQSTILLLLDTMDWCKTYIDNNSDKMINQNKWEKSLTIFHQGPIEQDAEGNYYCGSYVLSYREVNGVHNIGEIIKITQETVNSNKRTNHLYSKFAMKFEK